NAAAIRLDVENESLRQLVKSRHGAELISGGGHRAHADQIVEVNFAFVEWRKLAKRRQQIATAPELGAVAITQLLEADDEPFLEWLRVGDGESRDFFNASYVASRREIAVPSTGKNTTAGRENNVRLVGERLDHYLSANPLRFADQPDDRVLGPGHLGRACSPRRSLLRFFRRPEPLRPCARCPGAARAAF